ncbi:MAG: hypothetical protein HQL24_03805 [Candidatus Omnitrophica bacterium]|nr:hypothetical protein [Candidatus Omnitrophota bacterium]
MTEPLENDQDFEIAFYEGLLKKNPDFVDALIAIGDLYTKKGLYQEGLDVDIKLSSLRPDDAIVFYNLACSYSLLQQIDKSFDAIKNAIELGYEDFDYLLKDEDLKHLREDKRFQEYFGSLEEK